MPRELQRYRGASRAQLMNRASSGFGAYNAGRAAYNVARRTFTRRIIPAARGSLPNRSASVVRQQDFRASRKVRGRKKVKSIVHRKKRVKVSPQLRKKVQKVIDGTQHRGVYQTTRQSSIGVICQAGIGTTVEYRIADQGGYGAAVICTKLPQDVSSNARCWWAAGQFGDDSFQSGAEYQFFTPMKILDAASVLWNQKTASTDYRVQTGNLNTLHNMTTGALVTGTSGSMEIKGLKIMIKNCYVKWTMKNNSQRSLRVEMYKCVPVSKNPLATPLQTFADACDREVDQTNSSLMSIVGPAANGKDNLVLMPGVEPHQFKSFSNEWKYEKVTLKIAPGETTTLFCQGPKEYLLDYDKLNKGNENVQHLAFKQTTLQCMFAVTVDLGFATSNVQANVGQSGRWLPTQQIKGVIGDILSIETEEIFRLQMPDIVGFQNGPASDAGNMYTLNKRMERRAYGNFVGNHITTSSAAYTAWDEENPADPIIQNRFN